MTALVIGALVALSLSLALRAAVVARRPAEAAAATISPVYRIRIFAEPTHQVGAGLVRRIEDALWAVAYAGERRGLWTRAALLEWALATELEVTIVEGAPAARAVDRGVVLYLPRHVDLWRVDRSGLGAAFARLYVQEVVADRVPVGAEFWAAIAEAAEVQEVVELGGTVPAS